MKKYFLLTFLIALCTTAFSQELNQRRLKFLPVLSQVDTGYRFLAYIPGSTQVYQVSRNTFAPTYSMSTYTPVYASIANIDAVTGTLNYQRLGNSVEVWGTAIIDPTTTGAVDFSITLPIASNFTVTGDLSGMAANDSITIVPYRVFGDPTLNIARAKTTVPDVDTVDLPYSIRFKYIIK